MTDNSLAKVGFRQRINELQGFMEQIAEGEEHDALDDCPLAHHFGPMSDEYGCATYGREMFIPAGTLIVGRIHKHGHINVISKGIIDVATEFGLKRLTAPLTFVSEPGTKRAVKAITDTVWTTIHLISNPGEENVDEIVDTLTTMDYKELDMIDDTRLLENDT